MTASRKYVGKPVSRSDGPDKVTGKALYLQDFKLPEMLFGGILRRRHPHARIIRVDAARARRVSGVSVVLTAADVPSISYGVLGDNCLLKKEKVRSLRDEVAVAAGVDRNAVQEA